MSRPTPPDWNLDQLYIPDSPALSADLDDLTERQRAFAAHRETLARGTPAPAQFLALIRELEEVSRLAHRLSGFASLNFSRRTQDQKAQAFLARLDERLADLFNDLLFFEIWWKELPEEEAASLLAAAPDYRYWLLRERAFRPHTRPEAEEKIINLKNITGPEALNTLYDSLTNRYRFSTAFLGAKETGEVTRDQLMVHVHSHRPEVRAGAYRELYRVYGQDGPILGQIYQTRVRDWRIENLKIRGYSSPAEVRHKDNDLSAETVSSLMRVCREKAPLFGRFFKLKARVLGLSEFRRYDLYAPLQKESRQYDFPEAETEVLGAFAAFSPRFEELAGRILRADRFSAAPVPGKQSGAFCASLHPHDTPWILMNYNGRRQDLFTMAHELGHGIHSQLAADHNLFHFHATLPLAETASTFGEMLLARRLLAGLSGRDRAGLLFHLLDDAYATVCRQAFFAAFEMEAHEMTEAGATVDELAEAYYRNLEEQFGNSLLLSEEFKWEWVSIPHFYHTPFYVYAYSFGQLLVYSLWRLYEQEGSGFVPRLTALLARGGSASPEEILRESGFGPLEESFWLGGFDVVESFLKQLEESL